MSKYVRLRDAIKYHKENNFDISGIDPQTLLVACSTCGKVKPWKSMQAGHFIGRGLGGSSGVYLDQRNVHAQCPLCNAFKQGSPLEYREFMLDKYGQNVIDELHRLHQVRKYTQKEIAGLREYYRQEFRKLNTR